VDFIRGVHRLRLGNAARSAVPLGWQQWSGRDGMKTEIRDGRCRWAWTPSVGKARRGGIAERKGYVRWIACLCYRCI